MKRLMMSLRQDILLQRRYGFYYAALFVTLVWVILIRFLPKDYREFLLPLVIFLDLGMIGFYFIAGQIIFEKAEKTLQILNITPLSLEEYLGSKLVTFSFLAWLVSMTVAVASLGIHFNLLLFSLGVWLTSLLMLVAGVTGVAPYHSISSFIMPSQLYLLILVLPLLSFVGWLNTPLFYLIPTQGSLLLLKGAFNPIKAWQIAYAVIYQLVWILLLFFWARFRLQRYLGSQGGGKKE